MTTKEKVLQAVRDLPAEAPLDEVIDRLLLLAKIEKGLAQADAGQTLTQHEVQQRMAKWLQ